jgi:hypothetical protein
VLDGEEAKVVLFSSWDYYGESKSLNGDISNLGDFKNNVGSLKIAKGYTAILFDKKDFKGQSVVLSNQVPENLRRDLWYVDFWKKAESVKIIKDWPATVVYEDINYGGKNKIIKGWNTEFVGNDFNDIISSMVIPPNYGLIAYEHRSYRGRVRGFYRKISGGISWVGSDFNDLISSLDLYPPSPESFSQLGIAKKTIKIEETLVRDGTKAEGKFPGVDSNGKKLREVPVINIRGARCIAWLYFKPDKKKGDFKRGDFINVIFLGKTARGVNDFLQSLRKEKNKKVWKHWSEDNRGTSLWVAYNLVPASGGAKMKVTNCRAQEFTLRSGSYRGWSTHIRIYGIGYNVVVGGVHREHWNWKNSRHEEIDYNEGARDTYYLLSKYGSGKYKNIYLIETKGYLESGAKYVVVVEF